MELVPDGEVEQSLGSRAEARELEHEIERDLLQPATCLR